MSAVFLFEDWVSAKALAKEIENGIHKINQQRQAMALKRLAPKAKPKAAPLRRLNAFIMPSKDIVFARPVDPPKKASAALVRTGRLLAGAHGQ